MTPVELSRTVLRAVRRAVDDGELSVVVPEKVSVTVPGAGGWGDYATNIALQLARPAGETPRRVAELLRPHLVDAHGVSGVEITGPGFLNIRLGSTASIALVEEILRRGPRYGFAHATDVVGHRDLAGGQPTPETADTAEIADTPATPVAPTTPLIHLHAPHDPRALVVMDVVARLLRSQGTRVRISSASLPESAWPAFLGTGIEAGIEAGTGTDIEGDAEADVADVADVKAAVEVGSDVEADAYGTPAPEETPTPPHAVDIRPVPASHPADLLPLGRDAARWALLYPAAHDRPRLTADHLVQRESNPLFRVRYAYARTRAVSRNAADLGFAARPGDVRDTQDARGDVEEVTTPLAQEFTPLVQEFTPLSQELAPFAQELTPLLADHPRLLARAAAHRAPDLLARHLVAVADATFPLLAATLPLGDEKPSAAHRARLALAEAAGAVLAGGLSLLGIDAPEHL